jgi:hypothetical protein
MLGEPVGGCVLSAWHADRADRTTQPTKTAKPFTFTGDSNVSLNYRELKRRYELDGAELTVRRLSEALETKDLAPEDFSLRDLAEALVPDGREWVRLLDPRSGGGTSVTESTDGVDVTAFLNVAGQVVYAKILEAYT